MVDIDVAYEGGLRCRTEHAGSRAVVLTDAPADNHGSGDCQKFRVWAGIMGKKDPQYVTTQRTYDTQ